MKTKWDINQEAFDGLLRWLNEDRDLAGEKYEEIRRKLITLYLRRGCTLATAEELTDESMNRVSRKVAEIAASYVGDPALYCYGVAQNIYLEHVRKKPSPDLLPAPDPPEEKERNHQCLDRCMEGLDSDSRLLVLEYYREDKRSKIIYRKELADRRGLTPNTLRMRVLRIKTNLRLCVGNCVAQTEMA